jgi:translation initiation factor 2 subunit 1
MVKVKGTLELKSMEPDGVKIIKKAFLKAKKFEKNPNVKIRFFVIATPKYCIEVMTEDYKSAEDIFQKVGEKIISAVVKAGGEGTLVREK